jgi:LacI family gluconate utilization system Gnt-I transcriptional repressor
MSSPSSVKPHNKIKEQADKPYIRLRPGTNTVTMADVAKVAGFSAQTVSRVLRKPEGSAPHVREKVLEAVRATKYVQNLAASNLASNRSMTIAAVIPVISASIFAETVQGLSNVLVPAGYQIIIGHTDYQEDREEALVRSLLGRRPDAFFFIGTKHTKATKEMLLQAAIPVVESWDWVQKPIDQLVGFSNRLSISELVAYLRKAGYQRPAFVGSIRHGDDRAESRVKGYLDGMKAHFPSTETRTLVVDNLPYKMSSGSELLRLARERYPTCDAMMFSSDLFASGAMLACQALGLSVPGDLAITGFGDYEIAAELKPALTTIHVPSVQIGEEAANIILQRLNTARSGATEAGLKARKVELPYQLMVRGST